ncbi:uncharacterized protein ColSpa_05823 [Colletotrichum spaethianum]|uniref:Uncharacterized protein n=1 Tax=Colletotrichum spaethianum TaxID=700344 RepID=A0AA37LK21_9PEZI|nr:uncharacterized protein ColSpa_05823 [Colletotrichum spaethianum]GKT45642.1 hypothetical protein ColSpa_05823 [Colletotrichum spaethianum]
MRCFAIFILFPALLLTFVQVVQSGPLGVAIINTMPTVLIDHGRDKIAQKLTEMIERERRKKAEREQGK